MLPYIAYMDPMGFELGHGRPMLGKVHVAMFDGQSVPWWQIENMFFVDAVKTL